MQIVKKIPCAQMANKLPPGTVFTSVIGKKTYIAGDTLFCICFETGHSIASDLVEVAEVHDRVVVFLEGHPTPV